MITLSTLDQKYFDYKTNISSHFISKPYSRSNQIQVMQGLIPAANCHTMKYVKKTISTLNPAIINFLSEVTLT